MMQYLWEVSINLTVFYLAYLWLKQDTFHQRNRFYLIFTSLIALILPLLSISFFPEVSPYALILPLFIKAESSLNIINESYYFQYWLYLIYFLGILFFIIPLVLKLWKIQKFIQEFPKENHREYILIKTQSQGQTFSFFKYLFWENNSNLNEEEKNYIRLHELAHIQQRHSYDRLYFEILKIFFWFNPIIYFYIKELLLVQEYIADNLALQGKDTSQYQKLLLKTVLTGTGFSLTQGFKKSEITQRLQMLTRKSSTEWSLLKVLIVIPLSVFLIWVFSPLGIQFQMKPQGQTEWASVEGGLDNFYEELEKVLEYPPEAIKARKEGRVVLEFLVTSKGKVKDLKVVKSFNAQCSEAALKAFKKVNTKWVAGRLNGQKVAQKITLPIYFKLD